MFECQVTGTPEIDVYWFKEGSEISASDRHTITFVNSVATLEVCGADAKDGGLYYCEARNEAGSVSCSMELKVKGQHLTVPEFREPKTLKSRRRRRSSDGTDFYCLVS